jgi:glyoxylase-like metal-dependent hydrolase (beta-lactamase superfamily II)
MQIGQFEIHTFVEHRFKLDGGTMFGVIPRSLWQKMIPPDENNLIDMNINLFVLKAHDKVIIFDVGLGDTLSEREKRIYSPVDNSHLDEGLQALGLKPEDIDYVIMTHLHTDHAAGAVQFSDNGAFEPRFPNATYVASRKEWEAATHPDERTSAVYIPARYLAIEEMAKHRLIDHDTEILPGIKAVFTGGHSPGHFALEIESEGHKLYYYADIFCTTHHISIPYIPATDIDPMTSMEIKRKKLPEIVDNDVILAFDHDTKVPFGRVVRDGKRFVVEEVPA